MAQRRHRHVADAIDQDEHDAGRFTFHYVYQFRTIYNNTTTEQHYAYCVFFDPCRSAMKQTVPAICTPCVYS